MMQIALAIDDFFSMRGGRFVTFDGSIALSAVRGAGEKNLLILKSEAT